MPVDVSPTTPNPTHHLALIPEDPDAPAIGFILTDGSGKRLRTAIARSNLQTQPLKTSSGDSQYSDVELPFVVSAQSEFHQGIGQERFEDNRTKYHSGRRIQNAGGKVTLGPREHFTTGLFPSFVSQPRSGVADFETGKIGRLEFFTDGPINGLAMRFTPEVSIDPTNFYLLAKRIGSGSDEFILHWEIREDDNGDEPGTLVDSGDTDEFGGQSDQLLRYQDSGAGIFMPDVTGGVPVWLVLYPDPAATVAGGACVVLGYWKDPEVLGFVASTITTDDGGATWSSFPTGDGSSTVELIFRITEEPVARDQGGEPIEYKHQFYYLTRPVNPTEAPRLFMNGWRGAADSNAGNLNKLIDATQAWGTQPIGCIVWVYSGPGSEEEVAYRRVIDAANGELTVDGLWNVEHTNETEYVVLGSNRFFEIAHTIPIGPTGRLAIAAGLGPDGKSSDDERIIYIPQGHVGTPPISTIWLYREWNNAGTWTTESKSINDATGGAGNYRARHIVKVEDPTLGTILVKVEDNSGSGGQYDCIAEFRAPGTWAAQAAWGGDEELWDGDPSSLVNVVEFVNPQNEERLAWAFTRDKLFARDSDGLWRSVLIPALKKFASDRTGFAAAVHNTNLYLSLGGGLLEQLTNGTLVDVGPTKGVGLPRTRQGEIGWAESYPGKMFLVVDAGPYLGGAFSSIMQFTGLDSHDPIYEGGENRRIRWTFAQSIPYRSPGANIESHGLVNRLWLQENNDLIWLDLPRQGLNALTDHNYQFAPNGFLSMSRVHANLDDRLKVFSSFKIVSQDLDGGAGDRFIEVGYQLDQDNEEGSYSEAFGGFIDQSPSQEGFLTDYSGDNVVAIRGRFIKLRMTLSAITGLTAPAVNAMLIESLLGLPVKYAFSPTFELADNGKDLNDDPQDIASAVAFSELLEGYADNLEVFTLHSIAPALHGKKVVIASPEMRPRTIAEAPITTEDQVAIEHWIGSMSVIQVIL